MEISSTVNNNQSFSPLIPTIQEIEHTKNADYHCITPQNAANNVNNGDASLPIKCPSRSKPRGLPLPYRANNHYLSVILKLFYNFYYENKTILLFWRGQGQGCTSAWRLLDCEAKCQITATLLSYYSDINLVLRLLTT